VAEQPNGKRRIDRILRADYAEGLGALPLEDLRQRRDECLAEREYLSLLRRLVQGRAEILRDEVARRSADEEPGSLVERLSNVFAPESGQRGPSRGEALKVGVPEEEMLQARRRIERLVADAELSDPSALDDEQLSSVVERLVQEEQEVSRVRAEVIRVLDLLQGELKRRYKEDISQVLGS
jgi:hypothetical protein